MDYLQAYVTSNLPPSLLAHATQHSSTYWKLYQSVLGARDTFSTYTAPVLNPIVTYATPLFSPLIASLKQLNPDLTSFFLLVIVLILTLKILDMLRAAVMFWVRLAYRVVLYGGVVLVGLWVWQRGAEGAVEDIQGAIEWVVAYWGESYEGYKRQEEMAKVAQRLNGGSGRGQAQGWWGR